MTGSRTRVWRWLLSLLIAPLTLAVARPATVPRLENDLLKIDVSPENGEIRVQDKRNQIIWRQDIVPGYKLAGDSIHLSDRSLSYRVLGPGEVCDVTIDLNPGRSPGLDLKLNLPNEHYARLPAYPFHFVAPGADGWFYVQNTTGEGILMPLDRPGQIENAFSWSGSQPWWGLTDLEHGLMVRLDTFRNVERRDSVYGLPMRLHVDVLDKGGYVAMAQLFRDYFLAGHPELKPLRDRVSRRPPVAALKDAVYVYLWGENPADDLSLVKEMKAAGIEHGIAVFYGRHPVDKALFDGIKEAGWVPGMYQMPTGNLFRVGRHGWPNKVLTGQLRPDELRRGNDSRGWDRICAKYQLPRWLEKAKSLLGSYGPELFYFDTLVVQLAPCLSPQHPSTIEENKDARLKLMEETQQLGTVVGSGEGLCPTWALPGLDYFEGMMSLRTYADPRLKIPRGGYATDLGQGYAEDAAVLLDEKRRIPLYQLAFHDYVAGTWVWRDTNFQSRPFAWKKDLFNILYGTMPMWHINRQLWQEHKSEYVASYRAIASVRSKIGFAQMTGHGWLTPDRTVQYSDWSTGDRVIVNFGDRKFSGPGDMRIAPRSFLLKRRDDGNQ